MNDWDTLGHIWENIRIVLEFPLLQIQKFVLTPLDILLFSAILLGARYASRLVKLVIRKAFDARHIDDPGKQYTLSKVITYAIYFLSVILGLETLGLNIGVLWVSGAALFVGIGLGLQNIFNDILSGFILLFEGVIKKGHILEVNGMVCQVEQMDIRTSKIRTRDGIMIVVPNSKLTSQDIINWSHSNKVTRFKITVGVAYGSDTQLVKQVLLDCAKKHPDVMPDHPLHVRFEDFGDSALVFELYFWAIKTWEIEFIKSDLRFAIDQEFRNRNITIPFPQRDVHIKNS